MSIFSRRPFGYRFGSILLAFGVLLFVLSFASPYWYTLDTTLAQIHGGLWQNCWRKPFLPIKRCDSTKQGIVATDWMSTVQAMQCIGVAGLFFGCIYASVVNWVQKHPRYTRLFETFGVLSSIIGFSSSVIFVTQLENEPGSLSLFIRDNTLNGHYAIATSWALGLSFGSSILCLVASVIIGIYNHSIPTQDTRHHQGFSGYADPDTGMVYPVIIPTQEVFFIPGQTPIDQSAGACAGGAGGYQQPVVPLGFQSPPPYESAVASPPLQVHRPGHAQYFQQK